MFCPSFSSLQHERHIDHIYVSQSAADAGTVRVVSARVVTDSCVGPCRCDLWYNRLQIQLAARLASASANGTAADAAAVLRRPALGSPGGGGGAGDDAEATEEGACFCGGGGSWASDHFPVVCDVQLFLGAVAAAATGAAGGGGARGRDGGAGRGGGSS